MFGRLFGGGKKRDAELHAAAQSGDMAGVRQALDKSADINALDPVHRETVLQVAVDKERKAHCRLWNFYSPVGRIQRLPPKLNPMLVLIH